MQNDVVWLLGRDLNVRVNELSRALERLFDMDAEDAHEVSSVVMDAFGARSEVMDEALDQDVRSIFYTLEAKKLVSFRREEYAAETGERRRAFFWRLREDVVRDLVTPTPVTRETSVYQTLPAAAWARRAG